MPLTGFEGGLNLLHVADDDTGICSDCSTREIINKLTIYCTFCSLADIFLSQFVCTCIHIVGVCVIARFVVTVGQCCDNVSC